MECFFYEITLSYLKTYSSRATNMDATSMPKHLRRCCTRRRPPQAYSYDIRVIQSSIHYNLSVSIALVSSKPPHKLYSLQWQVKTHKMGYQVRDIKGHFTSRYLSNNFFFYLISLLERVPHVHLTTDKQWIIFLLSQRIITYFLILLADCLTKFCTPSLYLNLILYAYLNQYLVLNDRQQVLCYSKDKPKITKRWPYLSVT